MRAQFYFVIIFFITIYFVFFTTVFSFIYVQQLGMPTVENRSFGCHSSFQRTSKGSTCYLQVLIPQLEYNILMRQIFLKFCISEQIGQVLGKLDHTYPTFCDMKQPSQRISLPPEWDARHSTIIGLPVLTRQEWFSTECHKTDKSNYSDQSQRAQTIP